MNPTLSVLEARGTPGRVSGKQREATCEKEIVYPESDGKPMADNTRQFAWIVKIKEGLEVLFSDEPDVFVAGDLLWYPREGDNRTRVAPDAMVVFGRPKGDRGSYRQWEEGGVAPQVVFEILSPGNTSREMRRKLGFYERHGVEEYYQYDPDRIELKGWLRSDDRLGPISEMRGWISPRLGIRFEISADDLEIFRTDGRRFLSFVETEAEAEQDRLRAEQEKRRAEQEKRRAEQEKCRAEQEKRRSEREKRRAQEAEAALEKERQRAALLEAKLKELGIL